MIGTENCCLDLGEYLQALVQARPTIGIDRRPIRLVEGGLKYIGDVELTGNGMKLFGDGHRQIPRLQHVHPREEDEGLVVGNGEIPKLDLLRCHDSIPDPVP